MKYCQECGRMLRDADDTCPYCGTYQDIIKTGSMPSFDVPNMSRGTSYGGYDHGQYDKSYTYGGGDYTPENNVPMPYGEEPIPRYSFWKYFFLNIITFGIYGIYKNYKWTKDINKLCKGVGDDSFNYIIVLLLGFVTFGIYYYVWIYQQTERIKETGYRNGVRIEDSGVQNLLLCILLGGIGRLITRYILFDNTNRLGAVYNGDSNRAAVNTKSSHSGAIIIGIILSVLFFIVSTIIAVAAYAVLQENTEGGLSEEIINEFQEEFEEEIVPEIEHQDTSDFKSQGSEADFGDYSVNIIKAQKLYDFEDDPALAITFEWTNKSEEDASPLWAFNINAYQKDNLLEMTWSYVDDPDVSIDSYITNIKPGESGEFQVMFKVSDSETPVRIEVVEYSGKSKIKAEQVFDIGDIEA